MLSNTTSALSIKKGCAPIRGLRSKSRPFVVVAKLSVPITFRDYSLPMSHPGPSRGFCLPFRLVCSGNDIERRSFTRRQCSSERGIISVGMKLEGVHCVPIFRTGAAPSCRPIPVSAERVTSRGPHARAKSRGSRSRRAHSRERRTRRWREQDSNPRSRSQKRAEHRLGIRHST
jgi:hypothetical protein